MVTSFANGSQTLRIACEIISCSTLDSNVFHKLALKHYVLPPKTSRVLLWVAMSFTNFSQTRRIACENLSCSTLSSNIFRKLLSNATYGLRNHHVFYYLCLSKPALRHYALPAKSSRVPFVVAMSFMNCSETLRIACEIIWCATDVGTVFPKNGSQTLRIACEIISCSSLDSNVFHKLLSNATYCLRKPLVFHS